MFKAFVREFREFAVRGNVLDMAIGIIMGAAFGGIVNSLVADVMMPPLGFVTGRIDFKDKKVTLSEAVKDGEKVVKPAVEIAYGKFINSVISFVLVALAVFLLMKGINRIKRQAPPPPPDTRECPFCCSAIPKKAVRCAHCTSEVKAA
jgi:large conductance mechanosensitive channel